MAKKIFRQVKREGKTPAVTYEEVPFREEVEKRIAQRERLHEEQFKAKHPEKQKKKP
jgi:hypothetical protein